MAAMLRTRMRDLVFRTLRGCFRLLPLSEDWRDRLRLRFMEAWPALAPPPPVAQPPPVTARRAMVRSDLPAIGAVEHRFEPLPDPLPATVVAFYLPQFHSIPENDAWWGPGFTEWRNVTRALPQFEGHAQPRLPGGLGFYDLRNTWTMPAQVALAHEYGIGAFCFYFYWFQGRTLLDAPLERWLGDPSIEMPYCLCWANESWSRRWDGREDDILIAQSHDDDDDIAFIAHVSRFLRDSRYLRVDGKPLLLVYRPDLMPDPAATARRWRDWCANNDIGEITIAYVQGFECTDPRDIDFDSAVEFPPNLSRPTNLIGHQRLLNPDYAGSIVDWRDVAADYCKRTLPAYRLFPAVNCGWDNEPRRPGRGRSYLHASPRAYRDWLQHTIGTRLAGTPVHDRLVFVNAWNEWAEGAVLEPDVRLGHAWLQATRDALRRSALPIPAPPAHPCVVVHAWDAEAFDEIMEALVDAGLCARLLVTTTQERAARMQEILDRRGIVAELIIGENRGRDILPFLRIANRLLDEGEDIVLKLHTKQSTHRNDGVEWRRDLLSRLLSPRRAGNIHGAMVADAKLGLVAPEGHLQPMEYYWGANEERVNYLATRLGIPAPRVDADDFVAGSMFWVRLEALRPLLDAHLDEWEFDPEQGQVDGTCAHAIERIIALCVRASGHHVVDAATLLGLETRDPHQSYPYAAAR